MTTTEARPGARPAPPREPKSGLASLLALPGMAVRGIIRSTRATPGRLSVIGVGLGLLVLLTGIIATVGVQTKKDTINDLIDHREPLAVASQQVYRSLSDADATAASAFLSVGSEPPALRARYELDIAQAGAALAKAASDAGDGAAQQVNLVGQLLPVYTGLVETARANNKQGYPAGASYLREASELMRSKVLPAAQELYQIDTDRLANSQDDANAFPWLSTLLTLGLLAALAATQIHLTRKTNRVINVGLLVATGAVVVGLLWGSVAMIVQSTQVRGGEADGSHQVDVLVRARIAALQARADETLTLVARGDGASYEKDFASLQAQLIGADQKSGLLGEAKGLTAAKTEVEAANQSALAWFKAYAEIRKTDTSGQYDDAVKAAIDVSKEDGSAAAFLRLDENLVKAINVGRQNFLDDTRSGDRWLTLLAPGLGVLAVVAAGGVAIGIRERLREYR
ncbi:hypothetical protein AB5J62_00895 [Amycolatopsis sp. cg5]|uniref:hypothetical protein n=1 Tax=Amycolatopsis sp. cg5 TaxID=3238802 RepID=UPI0035234E77